MPYNHPKYLLWYILIWGYFLPVAKNVSKFHIQYIWKIVRGWHHQLAHLNIHKTGPEVFSDVTKCHIFLNPIFIIFSLFCRKKCTKIDSILEWSSPLICNLQIQYNTWNPGCMHYLLLCRIKLGQAFRLSRTTFLKKACIKFEYVSKLVCYDS